jgi:MSHA biogenesis protein MshI
MFSFLRKLKSAGRFVLNRSGAAISVVSVDVSGEKPKVTFCASFSFTENTAKSWGALARQVPLAKSRCLVVLASNEYQLMQVEAPNVPEAEVKQAVRWKLKDMLAYPLEQATVDVLDIPVDPNNPGRSHYMYAVAARNEAVRTCMEHAKLVGTDLDVIDIPELAQRNIAALLEEDGRGVALVAFNEDGGLLTFTSGGELYHARQVEINVFQLAAADEEQRLHNYERLVLELQRSLDNFERQFSYVAVTRLVIGPMQGQADLVAYLRENLYVKIETLNLADVLDVSAVSELEDAARQSECFYALGAALRIEGAVA